MKEELRKVIYTPKGKNQETNTGYFHKFATIKDYEYCGEFVIIEKSDGTVIMLNLEDYIIQFQNYGEEIITARGMLNQMKKEGKK